MSKTFSRVLWIISGVLLILCGILCLSRPVVALAAISLFLGLSMLFSGIVDIVIFARHPDRTPVPVRSVRPGLYRPVAPLHLRHVAAVLRRLQVRQLL